jgi:hypothetical protein
METTQLPTTAKLFLPAFFTVTRRPNLKSKMDKIEKKYFFDSFDEKNLKAYKELLHYKREDVPLPYLYLLAQKSQIALMLDKKFIFPLIGMVHMDNEMELLAKEVSVSNAGLIAHYKSNQPSGSTVKDISGNGNDMTMYNGASFVTR